MARDLPRWVIADTHFLLPDLSRRPADADRRLEAGWRRLVGPGDEVLHLGDVAGQNVDGLAPLLGRLPGRVTLVPGNWDGDNELDVCRQAGWELREPFSLLFGDWVLDFTHEPVEDVSPGVLNVHGHRHPPGDGPLEPTPQHINVAAPLHDWAPLELAPLVARRLASLRG